MVAGYFAKVLKKTALILSLRQSAGAQHYQVAR